MMDSRAAVLKIVLNFKRQDHVNFILASLYWIKPFFYQHQLLFLLLQFVFSVFLDFISFSF